MRAQTPLCGLPTWPAASENSSLRVGFLHAARGSKVSNMLTALSTVPFMKGDHIIGVRYFLHTLILIRAHVKQVLPPFTETGKMTSLELHGVSVMAQPVKLPPRLCRHPVGVPTTPLPMQLLADTHGKAAEDGPCTWAPPSTRETQTEFQTPDFSH